MGSDGPSNTKPCHARDECACDVGMKRRWCGVVWCGERCGEGLAGDRDTQRPALTATATRPQGAEQARVQSGPGHPPPQPRQLLGCPSCTRGGGTAVPAGPPRKAPHGPRGRRRGWPGPWPGTWPRGCLGGRCGWEAEAPLHGRPCQVQVQQPGPQGRLEGARRVPWRPHPRPGRACPTEAGSARQGTSGQPAGQRTSLATPAGHTGG
jgi:hypothetical protein